MTITIPRLFGALEGFFIRHGHWPSRVYVEPWVLQSHYDYAFDGNYDAQQRAILSALAPRIQFVGREGAAYLAEDSAGNQYDYGSEGLSEGHSGGMLVRAWLAPQR